MSEQKKTSKNIGGIWIKEFERDGVKKKRLGIQIEINGEKHHFTAFKNGYKKPGDKKPDYQIYPSLPVENKAAVFSSPIVEEDVPF